MPTATISQEDRYRYTLARERDFLGWECRVAVVLLNPSTADAEQDDPTIRKLKGFS